MIMLSLEIYFQKMVKPQKKYRSLNSTAAEKNAFCSLNSTGALNSTFGVSEVLFT